jgi:hypothetical protein
MQYQFVGCHAQTDVPNHFFNRGMEFSFKIMGDLPLRVAPQEEGDDQSQEQHRPGKEAIESARGKPTITQMMESVMNALRNPHFSSGRLMVDVSNGVKRASRGL